MHATARTRQAAQIPYPQALSEQPFARAVFTMIYVPVPVWHIEIDRPLPINIWDSKGNLLLRRGQAITSEHHRDHLEAHGACAIQSDYKAWAHSYDRLVYTMLRAGASIEDIAKAKMPEEVLELDYTVGEDITGDWTDVQAVLSTILHAGTAAKNPLGRLEGVQKRAMHLLNHDVDDSLFKLFQTLADKSLGYCATHALLCAVVCELTARKMGVDELVRPVLVQAALCMNISMAKLQDALVFQTTPLDAMQKHMVQDHPQRSVDMLRGFGVVNEDLLDIVLLHHDHDPGKGLERNLLCRRILYTADALIGKMATRSTRPALSALGAAKDGIVGVAEDDAEVARAMATVLGFYPPGTYVQLANGEKAVSAKKGASANTPVVVSVVNPQGLPLGIYVMRDTREKNFAIQSPVAADSMRIHHERVQRALGKLPQNG
jgi:HD-GYP domain-containing protein (c-di-GMP phosphodiesterase class II)